MILALLLLSVGNAFNYTSFDSTLSPADIIWPSGWVPSPLELSTNNEGVDITLTITCIVTVDYLNGSYLEVSIAGYTGIIAGQQVDSVAAGDYNIFTVPGLALTAGVYGPISIVIRQQSANGQIIAAVGSFGTIAVVPAITTVTDGITVVQSSNATTIAQSANFELAFNIDATIRKYDYFVISVDPLLGVANVSKTLDYSAISTTQSLLNTTGVIIDSTSNEITVYGIQQDIANGTQVNVTVSGFTLPSYVVTGSYAFNITFYRFGVPTTLYSLSGSGSGVATTAGNITINLTSTNNYVPFYTGVTTYATLTLTPDYNIPAGGEIAVSLDNYLCVDPTNNATQVSAAGSNFYISLGSSTAFTSGPVSTLGSAGQKFTLTATSAFNASTITVYLYGTLGGNVTVTATSTISSDGNIIDTSTLLISYAQTGYIIATGVEVYIAAQSSGNVTGGEYHSCMTAGLGLYVGIVPNSGVTFDLGLVINISLPLSTSAADSQSSIGFGSTIWGSYLTDGTTPTDFSTGTNAATAEKLSVSSNTISITSEATFATGLYYLLGAGTASNFSNIFLPQMPSSEFSQYEISVQYSNASAGTTYIYSQSLYFIEEANSTAALNFLAVIDTVLGIPAQVSFVPAYTMSFSGYTFTIDFELITSGTAVPDLGTNLPSGSNYGIGSIAGTNTQLITNGSYAILEITNITSITVATTINVTFPYGLLVSNDTYNVIATVYAVSNSTIKIGVSNATSTETITGASATAFIQYATYFNGANASETIVPAAANTIPSITTNTALDFVFSFTPTAAYSAYPMSISFSSGFNISSSASLTLGTSTPAITNYFLSAYSNVTFQTIYLSSVTATANATNFQLSGVITPWSSMTNNSV